MVEAGRLQDLPDLVAYAGHLKIGLVLQRLVHHQQDAQAGGGHVGHPAHIHVNRPDPAAGVLEPLQQLRRGDGVHAALDGHLEGPVPDLADDPEGKVGVRRRGFPRPALRHGELPEHHLPEHLPHRRLHLGIPVQRAEMPGQVVGHADLPQLKAHPPDEIPDLGFIGIEEHVVVEPDVRGGGGGAVGDRRVHRGQPGIVVQRGGDDLLVVEEIRPVRDHPAPAVLLEQAAEVGEHRLQLGLVEIHQQPLGGHEEVAAGFGQRGLQGFVIGRVHGAIADGFMPSDDRLHRGAHGVDHRG